MRPTRAMLTRALSPVPRFPATSSDDISGDRVMTVPGAIQDQSPVFLVHICAGQPCRGGSKKLPEGVLYGFIRYEAPGDGARWRVAKEITNENLCMCSRPVSVIVQHQSTVHYDFSGCLTGEHSSTHPMACGSPCVRPHRNRRDGKQKLRGHHS